MKKTVHIIILFAFFVVCMLAVACHNHSFSDSWSYDSSYHWHVATCSHENEISQKGEHLFEDNVVLHLVDGLYELKYYKCTICGYEVLDEKQFLDYMSISEEGEITISDFESERIPKNVYIPDSLNGITVRIIGDSAFSNCHMVERVRIPDSVTIIGYGAFQGSGLKSIVIPDSVLEIGEDVFGECSELEVVVLPSSLKSINSGLFWGCASLKSIDLPDGIQKIDSLAFEDCSSLESVAIPAMCEEVGYNAFKGCSSLDSLIFNSRINVIRRQAFMGCSSLAEVYLPDSVSLIGEYAFSDCDSLKYVRFPNKFYTNSLVGAMGYLFSCPNLEKIEYDGEYDLWAHYQDSSLIVSSFSSPNCIVSCLDGDYTLNGIQIKENFDYVSKKFIGTYQFTKTSMMLSMLGYSSSSLFMFVCDDSIIREIESWDLSDIEVGTSSSPSITITIDGEMSGTLKVVVRDQYGNVETAGKRSLLSDDWFPSINGAKAIIQGSMGIEEAIHLSPDGRWLVWAGMVLEKAY